MSYRVRLTPDAQTDLLELYEFLVQVDVEAAAGALAAIRKSFQLLELLPFSCRKAEEGNDATLRELVITFGRAGYVALFRITDAKTVTVLAVRHQREDDFH